MFLDPGNEVYWLLNSPDDDGSCPMLDLWDTLGGNDGVNVIDLVPLWGSGMFSARMKMNGMVMDPLAARTNDAPFDESVYADEIQVDMWIR